VHTSLIYRSHIIYNIIKLVQAEILLILGTHYKDKLSIQLSDLFLTLGGLRNAWFTKLQQEHFTIVIQEGLETVPYHWKYIFSEIHMSPQETHRKLILSLHFQS